MLCSVLKTKSFQRWAVKSGLTDHALHCAVTEMINGLIDAELGGGLVKKRIAVPGKGKRGGARTLLATNHADRWVFLFGFEKNERTNVTDKELAALKLLAGDLLALNDEQVAETISQGYLVEVSDENC